MKKYSQEIVDKIVADYPHMPTKELSEKHGIPLSTCYHIAANRNIRKTPERYAAMLKETNKNLLESGKVHRYKKGQPAWNKGQYMRLNPATEFKKGQMPHNYKPVGSERITKDGYKERKVADPKKWKGVHIIVWEEHHGPVPPKHKIVFKTSDRLNCDITNLEMITYKEAMLRNTIQRYPQEIVQAIKTISKLKKTIRNHGEKQN
jgi:hypothetical protein